MRGEWLLNKAVDAVVDIVELCQAHVRVEVCDTLLDLERTAFRICKVGEQQKNRHTSSVLLSLNLGAYILGMHILGGANVHFKAIGPIPIPHQSKLAVKE